MAQSDARIERQASTARVLWSNRGRILASTAALGLAALLAGMMVPPVHRVSIRVSAGPGAFDRWSAPAIEDLLGDVRPERAEARPGVLAAWADLIDSASTVGPDLGAERLGDGSLAVWAESGDGGEARRRAEGLADRLVRDGLAAPAPLAGEAPASPTAQALRASIAAARDALSLAEARLAEAEAEASDRGGADDGERATLDADREAATRARQSLRETERFARNLRSAAPAAAPLPVRDSQEWSAWRDALVRRDAVAAQVADLSRTLLDAHPRMAIVRLRLSDLEAELDAARQSLAGSLDRRIGSLRVEIARLDDAVAEATAGLAGNASVARRLADAQAERNGAQRTLEALEDALQATEQQEPEGLAAAPAPPAPAPVTRVVTETERRPDIWPIVAASAAFGFLASSLYTILGARRRDAPKPIPSDVPLRGRRRGPARTDEPAVPERRAPGPAFDVTSAEELIGGILASEISRLVLVAVGPESRPAAVEIVRRLALRGRQGALVDLSGQQLAARSMGVPPEAIGISDMIAGEATFAEIARRDFATQAEVFGAGRATIGEAAFLAMERRNVLEFIERNYEVLLVVCGDQPLDLVKALLTADSALVVTVDAGDGAGIEAGVRRLRDAGLDDMILADGRQLNPSGDVASARAASS